MSSKSDKNNYGKVVIGIKEAGHTDDGIPYYDVKTCLSKIETSIIMLNYVLGGLNEAQDAILLKTRKVKPANLLHIPGNSHH